MTTTTMISINVKPRAEMPVRVRRKVEAGIFRMDNIVIELERFGLYVLLEMCDKELHAIDAMVAMQPKCI